MMRKVFLTSVLLLILILLSTTPTVAKGPPRIERYVDFDGALDGDGELYVDEKGKNIAIYGRMPMTFYFDPHEGDDWEDFRFRLTLTGTETGEVEMGSGFDVKTYTFPGGCEKEITHQSFGGSGTYSYDDATKVYTITLEDASFAYLKEASTNKKCNGYGPVYEETHCCIDITFTVEIDD